MLLPVEAGAGNAVNRSARSPRAFHLKHAENVFGKSPPGTTPVWIMPNLEAIEDDAMR